MRKSLFLGLIGALVLFVSCVHDIQEVVPVIRDGLTLTAVTEQPAATRTAVESGTQVWWEPGDSIKVFCGSQAACFVSDLSERAAQADFFLAQKGFTIGETDSLWALYPYAEEAVFDGQAVTTTLPSTQVARAGSFGKNMNLSLARTTGRTLQFYNVGGGIRFTVTEEGIRKVIFEGLGGESISGKVKIGFDESGIPVVQEVVGGSQFITLLPPEGEDVFQKDTWYYLVAIPGALEKGYKLRFYKDTDYARKVSEKVAQIKRSIYGSIERADMGIEYEATTTHFPETEEEWVISAELTLRVGEKASILIDSLRKQNSTAMDYRETLLGIEGVIDVLVNSEYDLIAIMQKDSVVVNYPNPQHFFHTPESLNQGDESIMFSQKSSTSTHNNKKRATTFDTSPNNAKEKKALILIPCEMPGYSYYTYHNKYIRDCLMEIGYESDNIVSKLGPEAEIKYFKGEELSKYDYIHITSHGSTGYYAFQPKRNNSRIGTCFASATEYDASWTVHDLAAKEIDRDEIAMFYCDNIFDDVKDSKCYLCMTSDFLRGSSFDNTCVIVTACHSAETINGVVGGTILSEFVNNGSGVASGYRLTANGDYSEPFARFVTKLICHGVAFQDAVKYLKEAKWFDEYLFYHGIERKRIDLQNEKISMSEYESYLSYISHSNLFYCPQQEETTQPYYFNKLSISLNDVSEIANGVVPLSWEFNYVPFIEEFTYTDYSKHEEHKDTIPFDVHYDVYIDDDTVLTPTVTSEKSVIWESPSVGSHRWFVVATIVEGDTVIASYRSNVGRFIVYDRPEAKDLGLPSGVKWASFNLGANKPEKAGYYYAWGELDPGPEMKTSFQWITYKWNNGSQINLTKYNSLNNYGVTDNKMELVSEDDVAYFALGDKWRLPTRAECQELIDKCTWEWDSLNGVNGYNVTSKVNGQTIFLPAAGYMNETILWANGSRGRYWASETDAETPYYAGQFNFRSSSVNYLLGDRFEGCSIRPVYGDKTQTSGGDIEGTEREPWN